MAQTTTELLWIQSLLPELMISFRPIVLNCDNFSSMGLTHNPILHSKTEHKKMNLLFLRKRVLDTSNRRCSSKLPYAGILILNKTSPLQVASLCCALNSGCLIVLPWHLWVWGGPIRVYSSAYIMLVLFSFSDVTVSVSNRFCFSDC